MGRRGEGGVSKATRWLPLFTKFIKNLRITSKWAESDPDGTGIPLRMWLSQKMTLEKICDALENDVHVFYVLKSRQLGVTTITMAIILFWLALNANTIGIYVSDNEDNAVKGRTTIKKYVESLAPFMGKSFSISRFNKHTIEFSNGSRLDIRVAGKTKANWGEGEGYIVGHLTECSKYGQVAGLDSFRHAMAPQNPRALYIFESTANGPNHWQTMWENARKDEHTSCCIFVGWWSSEKNIIKETSRAFQTYGMMEPTPQENDLMKIVRDRYGVEISREQLAWKRWSDAQSKSGEGDVDQNQPWHEDQAFVESGFSFFQTRRVAERINQIVNSSGHPVEKPKDFDTAFPGEEYVPGFAFQPYRFYLGDEYHLSQKEWLGDQQITSEDITLREWEAPVEGAQYAIGCDPAFGRNDWQDRHAIEVWRCFADKCVQVAEYADHAVDTRQAAWVLAYLAGRYYPNMVNIDLGGGPGQIVMQEFQNLRDRMRSDMYQAQITRPGSNGGPSISDDFLSSSNWYLYRRVDSPGPGFMYGTKMSHDLKFRTMNGLRDAFVTNLLEIRSIPLLKEMLNVRQTGPDIGAAAQGRDKDDRTFATALVNMTWTEHFRPWMVTQGITWEGSRAQEGGRASDISVKLNRMVHSVFLTADQEMDMPPPRSFLDSRGLRA
jgi:hypothetical protein